MASDERLSLSNLQPAQARRDRKRIGRGQGSGKGRYSGRGIKGQKSRSGSSKMRPGFEGGQMPIQMRLGKARGPYSKDGMPMGPHRTSTAPVNVRDLERFDEGTEVTPELLAKVGLIRNTRIDVKILGTGELTRKLTVTAHRFSATARTKIEEAGGTVNALRATATPAAERPVRDSEPVEGAGGNPEAPPADHDAPPPDEDVAEH